MSLDLDLSGVKEEGATLPDGKYCVVVDSAEVKQTKAGGEMISVKFKITEGDYRGRPVYTVFNIKNANPKAVQIGLATLKTMMSAFGAPNKNKLGTTQELVGLSGVIQTKLKLDDYGATVQVKGYTQTPAMAATTTNTSGTTTGAAPF